MFTRMRKASLSQFTAMSGGLLAAVLGASVLVSGCGSSPGTPEEKAASIEQRLVVVTKNLPDGGQAYCVYDTYHSGLSCLRAVQ